jgi:hypothetical protein
MTGTSAEVDLGAMPSGTLASSRQAAARLKPNVMCPGRRAALVISR